MQGYPGAPEHSYASFPEFEFGVEASGFQQLPRHPHGTSGVPLAPDRNLTLGGTRAQVIQHPNNVMAASFYQSPPTSLAVPHSSMSRSMAITTHGAHLNTSARAVQPMHQMFQSTPMRAQDSGYSHQCVASSAISPFPGSRESLVTSPFSPPRRGPKLYTCDICEKQFVRPSSLTTHRLSHTGEKPHSCATCGKSFSVASNLRRHEMTLHGPRPQNEIHTSYEPSTRATTSGGATSMGIVGCTNSSMLYRRGTDIYENIVPSHEHSQGMLRGSSRSALSSAVRSSSASRAPRTFGNSSPSSSRTSPFQRRL